MSAIFEPFIEANKRERKQQLGHELAIEQACIQIECYCVRVDRPGTWWNTKWISPDEPEEVTATARAVEYLDLCDLLDHDRHREHIVRIRHELLRK